jgi:AI-2 transport protein TqsA
MNNLSGRLVIYLVGMASIFVILFGIRGTASIINPILLAIVITITALPIPGRLTRRGMPGWLALVLTILAVVLLLGLVIATVFFSVTRLSVELPAYMAEAAVSAAQAVPAEVMGLETPVSATQLTIQFGPVAQSMAATVIDLLVQFAMALFIFFFMISAAMSLPGAVRLGLDPSAAIITRIGTLTGDVRRYMTILTGINFLVGMSNTVFLWFLGVDYALLWGLLAWFMGYIPSIGFIIALVPPVLLAYAQYGLSTAVIVLVGYVINPVVVFIGLFIWGYLLGGIGALLAVPLTLLVLTVMENFEGTRPLAILMRYTGEENKEERKEAAEDVKGLWGKVKGTFSSNRESEDNVE